MASATQASYSGLFTPSKRASGVHQAGGWACPSDGLYMLEMRNIFYYCRKSNDSSVVHKLFFFFWYLVEVLVSVMLFTEIIFHSEDPIKLIKLYWPKADTCILRSMKIRNFGALRD